MKLTTKIYIDTHADQNSNVIVGYSGSSTIDNVILHTSYIPLQMMSVINFGWKQVLDDLHLRTTFNTVLKENDLECAEDATKIMQEKFPGEYVVEEDYDVDRLKFTYKLKFNSREDQVLFILKYGDE